MRSWNLQKKRTEAVSAGGIHADGLASEITEHQRADAARRASELRYRLLFENNVEAIIRNTLTVALSNAMMPPRASWVTRRPKKCWAST